MPKIEIELAELDKIRAELSEWQHRAYQAEELAKTFSPEIENAKIIKLSQKMFEVAMGRVFDELGIKHDSMTFYGISFGNLEHFLGKEWWSDKEKLEVTVGATITNNFRRAYLNMTIVNK